MRVLAALDRRTLALLLCNAALLCVVALQAASRSHFKAQVHALTLDLVVVSRDRNNLLALLPPTGVVGESEAVRAAALENWRVQYSSDLVAPPDGLPQSNTVSTVPVCTTGYALTDDSTQCCEVDDYSACQPPLLVHVPRPVLLLPVLQRLAAEVPDRACPTGTEWGKKDMCCDQDGKCKKPLTLVLPWVPKPAAAAGGAKGGNSKAGDKDS